MPAKKKAEKKGITPGGRYQQVAGFRRDDFKSLLAQGRFDAAVYLAGYVIECQLKYAVTLRQGTPKLDEKYEKHEWGLLVERSWAQSGSRPVGWPLRAYSEVMEIWSPGIRYQVNKFKRVHAERFCMLVQDVYDWIREALK